MKQVVNERRHEIQQLQREIAQRRDLKNMRRQQITKVIPDDRLQYLLTLDEDHLESMTYRELKGGPPR